MAYLIALGILSLLGIVATIWLVRTDGYGRIPTDPTRVDRSARQTPAREDPAPAPTSTRPATSTATTPLRVVRAE